MFLKIIIDTFVLDRRFRNQGSYVYARSVIEAFLRLEGPDVPEFRIVVPPGGSNDAQELRSGLRGEFIDLPQLRAINQWRLGAGSRAMGRLAGDIVYCPAPINCAFSRTPAIVTIHDVTAVKMPSQTRFKNSLERSIVWSAARFSQKVITDSESSKQDLMETYGIPGERIAVIYLGYDEKTFHPDRAEPGLESAVRRRYRLERPYLIHHGVVQPRKNLRRLIEACRLVLQRHPDLDLDIVLAGPIGWQSEDIVARAKAGGERGKVILTGPVSQEELATLIRCADLCVIPSLYEGFCLPLLEAMACGTPTVASRSSCLPEISGGALRYFDPLSIEEMAAAIYHGICDDELRRQLRERGLRRASQFSWERCARETLSVITGTAPCPSCGPSLALAGSIRE